MQAQQALAFAAGIDRTYQSQIERAIGNPSLRVLCAIADALGVDLLDLLSERRKFRFEAGDDSSTGGT